MHRTAIDELLSETLGLDSSMKDEAGVLRVSHFALDMSLSIARALYTPVNTLALPGSPVANAQHNVLERSSMNRSHGAQTVHVVYRVY